MFSVCDLRPGVYNYLREKVPRSANQVLEQELPWVRTLVPPGISGVQEFFSPSWFSTPGTDVQLLLLKVPVKGTKVRTYGNAISGLKMAQKKKWNTYWKIFNSRDPRIFVPIKLIGTIFCCKCCSVYGLKKPFWLHFPRKEVINVCAIVVINFTHKNPN